MKEKFSRSSEFGKSGWKICVSKVFKGKMNVCACFLFMLTFAILDIVNVESAKSSQPKRFKDPSKYVKCSENSKTFWPDYKDRKFYYECLGDDYYARRPCPPKKVFNYKKQQCIFPEINNISEHKKKKEKFSPPCLETGQSLLWPDPTNHRVYYKCSGVGKSQKLMCPLNEIFEFSVQMCVVEPDMEITTPSTSSNNFQQNSIEQFPQCSIGELHLSWPSSTNPQIYYFCTGFGEFEVRECRYGSIFNFLKQFCELDETRLTSSTSTSTSTTTTTTTTTETPTTTTELVTTSTFSPIFYPSKVRCLICWRPTCDVNELTTKWPDYDSPTNYFKCLKKNVMILKKCPMDLVFNFESQNCVQN